MENLLSILPVLATDLSLVDFTFWIGFAAMLAATMFFFSAMNLVADKWKTSMLVSALITGIAALHYYYMRNAAMEGDITTAYRYVDWILTVPLMCVEFYLILKPSGATKGMFRPGESTAMYIENISTKLTTIGALYLTLVCLMPEFLIANYPIPFYLGGASILIVVVVAIDTVTQIQTRLMSSQYEQLIKKTKFGR